MAENPSLQTVIQKIKYYQTKKNSPGHLPKMFRKLNEDTYSWSVEKLLNHLCLCLAGDFAYANALRVQIHKK